MISDSDFDFIQRNISYFHYSKYFQNNELSYYQYLKLLENEIKTHQIFTATVGYNIFVDGTEFDYLDKNLDLLNDEQLFFTSYYLQNLPENLIQRIFDKDNDLIRQLISSQNVTEEFLKRNWANISNSCYFLINGFDRYSIDFCIEMNTNIHPSYAILKRFKNEQHFKEISERLEIDLKDLPLYQVECPIVQVEILKINQNQKFELPTQEAKDYLKVIKEL